MHERVLEQAREMRMVRAGELQPVKSPGKFVCIGCPFRDPCEQHEVGADWRLLLATSYTEHDPYDQYNTEQEGK
jgi:hypothetical protein